MIIRMIFLHRRIVPLAQNAAGRVIGDAAADRATALVITFLPADSNAHEIGIGELTENSSSTIAGRLWSAGARG